MFVGREKNGAGDVYVAYVLDRTGSMAEIWEETVSGFEAFVREQARQEGRTALTLICFDNYHGPQMEVPFLGADAGEVAEAGVPNHITPRGTTPLYDAIAAAVRHTDAWLAARPGGWSGKVLVAVNTDGLENASVEHSRESVKAVIEAKRRAGWEFVFMGAGIDAFTEATGIGMDGGMALRYAPDPDEAAATARRFSEGVLAYRRSDGEFEWDEES